MAKKTQYWIEAGDIKTNLPAQHNTGAWRSLDEIVWDILKCCGIEGCCSGDTPTYDGFAAHAPVTIVDTNSIDLSIVGQQIQAKISGVASALLNEVPYVSNTSTDTVSWSYGPVSSVIMALGSLADDTAAGGAGVPVGGFYHTAGVIKIRLV